MDPYMKGNGSTTCRTGKDTLSFQMVNPIKVNLKKGRSLDKEFTIIKMVIFIREIGMAISNPEMVPCDWQTGISMRDNG